MDTDTDAESTEEGVQRIPAVISVAPVPAVADARDALLAAIASEARTVTENNPGQASVALEQLARAFALIAAGAPVAAVGPASAGAPLTGRSQDSEL
ncbi:hypothetical protein [Streptomyces sp. RKAG293]|uniref:hypothetical protein n=1 Tax=Streptomyces sp. RKAG293 TaxID=2893403 RepID=UPI0020339028|nr:hypothetical protein [Streptomyces sp. RKAG293]MCM2416660.1 hypothetical protein [Streptomyces sp. RKAG293]